MQRRKFKKPIQLGLGLKKPDIKTTNEQSEKEELARVFEEFAESFKSNEKSQPKAFVKSNEVLPGNLGEENGAFSTHSATVTTKAEPRKESVFAEEEETEEEIAAEPNTRKKKRNLDEFLEEIKHTQERRTQQQRQKAGSAQEQDDGATTNLYIGNLHPTVDEHILSKEFGRFGPIGSVKVMWPRTDAEHARKRNSGFVSFMDRECASAAMRAMDGRNIGGYEIRVCWGKRVSVPPKPVANPSGSHSAPLTGRPFNATATSGAGIVYVERPVDLRLVRLIHWTVEHVIRFGVEFECALMARERENPRFRFLVGMETPEHAYYRWRMFSLVNGDTKTKWRTDAFLMHDKGPEWVPPRTADAAARINHVGEPSDSEEDEREEHKAKGKLGSQARARLERRLKRLRAERGAIAEAMVFSIEHASAAHDVADVICASLVGCDDVRAKVAHLLLVSDILHNCSAPVPHAWTLRDAFSVRLSAVFAHLAMVYKGIAERLRAEGFRRQVLGVLAVWEAWMVFPQDVVLGFSEGFL